jgi:hypothetical protein
MYNLPAICGALIAEAVKQPSARTQIKVRRPKFR